MEDNSGNQINTSWVVLGFDYLGTDLLWNHEAQRRVALKFTSRTKSVMHKSNAFFKVGNSLPPSGSLDRSSISMTWDIPGVPIVGVIFTIYSWEA